MSFTRYCEGLRQPCPHPRDCAVDCHFTAAELPEPEPVWLDIGEMVSGFAKAVLMVIACLLTALVLVGVMV